MTNYETFYAGADYGLDPSYGLNYDGPGGFSGYRITNNALGYPTDPTTANQIQKVSEKISTGTKTIEVSGLGIMGGGGALKHLDSIPKQQFDEIRRLKELTGVDLTFHGPLVEPTGVARQGWTEYDRENAEKEIWEAVRRGKKLGDNIPIVFHSSNGLPAPEEVVIDEKTGKEKVKQIFTVNEKTGQFAPVTAPEIDYLKGEKFDIKKELETQNEENWFKQLQNTSYHAYTGANILNSVIEGKKGIDPSVASQFDKEALSKLYKQYLEEGDQKIVKEAGPDVAPALLGSLQEMTHGDLYVRDAYQGLQKQFNEAYYAVEKDMHSMDKKIAEQAKADKEKLDAYRSNLASRLKKLESPDHVKDLAREVVNGVNVLRSIKPPQQIRPIREFAIDKASETFANVALKSYGKFKDKAPILAIENPPAGSGLSRADEMKDLIEAARDKFVQRASAPKNKGGMGLSHDQAKKQAAKLIGATWDVGHINMIRKFGASEKKLLEETKTIAPYVKHVHLSDNFGMEHTELPMGMGNVPTKGHLELIDKYNKQAKKIVETGDWFSRQGGLGQTQTPVLPSVTEFGSPLYSMKMSPYWNQVAASSGSYYGGIGATNPNLHHQMYGAGYSNLPVDLGGQMAGQSRMGGAPFT